MLRRVVLAACLVGASELTTLGQARPPSADELATSLQKKYETVRDFSADFVHTYQGGVLRKTVTESGSVLIKKPAKMRWTYTKPEQKIFVSDGLKLYSYIPADKQVIVSAVPPQDQATTAVLFLAGKGNLTRDFKASYDDGAAQGLANTYSLKLVPRHAQPEYDWLVLVVDRQTLQLKSLVTSDPQGGRSTFVFSHLKENVGLPDKLFTFKIPRGVDVVSHDDASS